MDIGRQIALMTGGSREFGIECRRVGLRLPLSRSSHRAGDETNRLGLNYRLGWTIGPIGVTACDATRCQSAHITPKILVKLLLIGEWIRVPLPFPSKRTTDESGDLRPQDGILRAEATILIAPNNTTRRQLHNGFIIASIAEGTTGNKRGADRMGRIHRYGE